MKSPSRAHSDSAPKVKLSRRVAPTNGIKPQFSNPAGVVDPSQPTTLVELFVSLGLTVTAEVAQTSTSGKKSKHQDYALPWAGFTSWRDARDRLSYFERHYQGRIEWAPFNDSTSNDGPMSLNAYPGRAFIERVTNAGDANLEMKAIGPEFMHAPMPASPMEAAAKWFGLTREALIDAMTAEELRGIAQKTVTVSAFVGDGSGDHKASVFDARDYGIGLSGAQMPSTILSLNRGNKKSKAWLTGKHGQGASSTYQYSDLTLIASRYLEGPTVSFTFVEAVWEKGEKTPTYKYMLIDGEIPTVELPIALFPQGTLVRHIGYNAPDLFNPLGENSLYGLLMRSLAEPLFPVWLEMYSLKAGTATGYPTFPGYRRYGRTLRGTVHALERAWRATQNTPGAATNEGSELPGDRLNAGETPPIESADGAPDASVMQEDESLGKRVTILHRNTEHFTLPRWNYGGRAGEGELGSVRFTYWVVDPRGKDGRDATRSWVDPEKPIVMTLDGQTHAEESRAIVTGKNGANLWAVGRSMVVQIDCNGLDPKAKYELFTSTREHAKETPIKKMILEELVRRLGYDKKLQDLNVELAAADVKQNRDDDNAVASLIKKYLRNAGVSFDQITRKVEKWADVSESQQGAAPKKELLPIQWQEHPTFVRWKFAGPVLRLYPGQRHSAVFETDAPPAFWNAVDQRASKIKVLANGVTYVGAGEMIGGRVRCHFECPADAGIGTKGRYLQVQLELDAGASIKSDLPVEIIRKPEAKKKLSEGEEPNGDAERAGDGTGIIKVKIRRKDFSEVDIPVVRPQPVERKDSTWAILGWPHDPSQVGFSIRSVKGKIHLYYNAEFPPLLDLKRRMSKKSLEDEFVRRYQIKLILHTIFSLNYELADEDDMPPDARARLKSALCATAESLALATKSELEIESKLKSEDGALIGTVVAGDLTQAAQGASEEAPDQSGGV